MRVQPILIAILVGVLAGWLLGARSPLLPQDSFLLPGGESRGFGAAPGPDAAQVVVQAGGDGLYLTLVGQEGAYGRFALRGEASVHQQARPDVVVLTDVVYAPLAETPALFNRWGDRLGKLWAWLGQAFIRLITMLVVPLVFTSLVVGVASVGDSRRLGRMTGKVLAYFIATSAIAITIGVLLADLLRPGDLLDSLVKEELLRGQAGSAALQRLQPLSLGAMLLGVIPDNPVRAMANGDLLPLIVFALFLGVALSQLPDGRGRPVLVLASRLNDALILCVRAVMVLAPIGVAALLAVVVGQSGVAALAALAAYAGTVLLGLALVLVGYLLVLAFVARRSPRAFLRAVRPAQLLAFATSSSAATLPVSLEVARERLRLPTRVSNLILPLGTTINMDGTALYQGVAAVFIAQVFGLDLTLTDQARVVLTATLASIGAAGVPSAGMITLVMVLESVGVPAVGMALILGPDRLLDMFRTAVNVTGDLTAASVVARWEGDAGQDPAPPERLQADESTAS